MSENRSVHIQNAPKYRRIIQGVCAFLFTVTLLLLDLAFTGTLDPGGDTVEFRKAIPRTVIFPLATGILLGHWFHPGRYERNIFTLIDGFDWAPLKVLLIGASIALVLIVLGLILYLVPSIDFYFPAWSMALTGIVLGAVFWAV